MQNQQETPQKDKKDKKQKFVDPGISFTNMNVPGMPYNKHMKHADDAKVQEQKFTASERRKIVWAGFKRFAPMILIIAASFTLVAVLMWLWLGGACN